MVEHRRIKVKKGKLKLSNEAVDSITAIVLVLISVSAVVFWISYMA